MNRKQRLTFSEEIKKEEATDLGAQSQTEIKRGTVRNQARGQNELCPSLY